MKGIYVMFRLIFQLIFTVSAFLFSLNALAADYKYTGRYIDLSGKNPRIYLLKNISNETILLNRYQRVNPGASAGWSSMINPKHWSALFLTQTHFKLTCTSKNIQNKFQKVPCIRRIQVFAIKKFTKPSKSEGGYWIAENQRFHKLLKIIKRRGFHFEMPRP